MCDKEREYNSSQATPIRRKEFEILKCFLEYQKKDVDHQLTFYLLGIMMGLLKRVQPLGRASYM